MIRLVNGRGQLGSAMRGLICEYETQTPDTTTTRIYHTWNPWDKSKEVQQTEYNTFIQYVDKHKDEKIIFVSTYSQNDNYYVHYKQLAEAYLLTNHPTGVAVRLPNIIGKKGIVQKLKEGTVEPYGEMEIISLSCAARSVMDCVSYEGIKRLVTVRGHSIPALVVYDLFAGTR